MNWRIKSLFLLAAFVGCNSDQSLETESKPERGELNKKSYLISIDELKKISKIPTYKILDFREREDYEKGHIKGAMQIWRTDIEDQSYPYKGMMASRKQIENLFSNLGIASSDTIVIYDDKGLCNATRLWWLLENYDFTNTKLFQGGLGEWKAYGGEVSTEAPILQRALFKLSDTPSMRYYVSREEMPGVLNSNTVFIDTRTLDEFSGKKQKKGAAKGGRIPGSIHLDWAEAINYSSDKKLKSIKELESIYGQLQIGKDDPIIVYCHSGFRSAHTTFVLTQLLHYSNVKNYDGSWTEWSYFNELPFEKDSITRIIN